MLTEATVLVSSWRSVPPERFLAWFADNAQRLFDFFGPLQICTAVVTVAAAALYALQSRTGTGLLIVSALLALAVLGLFPLYFRDANAAFADGTIASADIAAELARWSSWQWGRTCIGTGAFVVALLAVRDRMD
jgi:hypothetical protein